MNDLTYSFVHKILVAGDAWILLLRSRQMTAVILTPSE